jgi:hypothetical protein
MTKTANDYRHEAAENYRREQESFDRSDTDGFLSQWASSITGRLNEAKAKIKENGDKAEFVGLYEGNRRVKAKVIETRFGTCWLLHEDEEMLRARRGKPFLPTGKRSRVLKRLGLQEKPEEAPAWATLDGNGTGLSGACSAYVKTFRTGDPWGTDAEMK